MKQRAFPLIRAAAIVALDRATKLWIESSLAIFDTFTVIPGFFNIIHSRNTGMAFSLLEGRRVLLVSVSVLIMCFLVYLLWTSSGNRAALGLVIGGAAGNLYDRALRGFVTDFLDVYVGANHWPTFNVADSAITIGAILLIIGMRRERTHVP